MLDDERNIIAANEALIEIAESENFDSDNLLEMPKDSYQYLSQLLKTSNEVDGKNVRPFVVFLYVVSKVGYLTYDEFTYLLPLCVNREITEELICNIGINRKSARYDKPYYILYNLLKSIVFTKDNLALELYEATKKLTNSKVGGAWRKYFFRSNARSVIKRMGLSVLNAVPILQTESKEVFNEEFFKIMHLFKAKSALSDYFDLAERSRISVFKSGRMLFE